LGGAAIACNPVQNKKSVNALTAFLHPNSILTKKEAFMAQTKTKHMDPAWEAWEKTLPEVDYPPEVVARWEREIEIARAQIATGELAPQTVADFFTELEAEIERERGNGDAPLLRLA
jgi:hypothetical protein